MAQDWLIPFIVLSCCLALQASFEVNIVAMLLEKLFGKV